MKLKTGYSFRHAVGHLPEVISRLVEIGSPIAPIADTCSTFGFVRWTKLAKEAGLRPIYGVALNVVPELGAPKPVTDEWTFFAKDSLRPLHDLIYLATSNPGKEPSLLYRQALEAPGLIKLSGNRTLLDRLEGPLEGFYLSLAPDTPRGLLRAALARSLPVLAASCNVFPRQGDLELYRVLLGRRSSTQTYPQWILSDSEWQAATSWADPETQIAALRNRDAAAALCAATLKQARMIVPEKPKTLRLMCEEGAAIKGVDLSDAVYGPRLYRELAMIAEKEFEDYFYLVADMVSWAKERMVVGPARGSSCGSLVCYLLDITAIDPLKYDLLFERFIDITRGGYRYKGNFRGFDDLPLTVSDY